MKIAVGNLEDSEIVAIDIYAKVTLDDFVQIPLVDLSLLGSDIVFLVVDAVLDNCSMRVLIVNEVNSSPIESVTGLVMVLVMELVIEPVLEPVLESVIDPVIGPAMGSGIRRVMKPGIWILFSVMRPLMTLGIGPVMKPETEPVIGPGMGPVIGPEMGPVM